MRPIRFTKEGFEKLKQEYETLRQERPAAVVDLRRAREMGDLSENGYYKAARAKLSSIDYRLRTINYQIKNSVVAQQNNSGGIGIGSSVTLEQNGKLVTYRIVGDLESNPSHGDISLNSPLGRALNGRKEGDEVTIRTPSGSTTYKILSIK